MAEEKMNVLYTVDGQVYPSTGYRDALEKLKELSKEYTELKGKKENRNQKNNEEGKVQPSRVYAKGHDLFVKKCLMPFPKKGEKKTVFIKWLDMSTLVDGGNVEDEIHLTVMTPEMLLTDYLFYTYAANWIDQRDDITRIWNEELDNFYKPYYYAFDQYGIKNIDRSLLNTLKEKDGSEYKWFRATICLANEDERNVTVTENMLRGNLCFSASQYEIRDIFMKDIEEVEDEELREQIKKVDYIPDINKINGCVVDVTKTNILNALNGSFDADSYISIYNVGQANCLYIYLKDKGYQQRIFFDVGRPYDKVNGVRNIDLDKKGISASLSNISFCCPHMVILSHWHRDHVLASQTLGMAAYDKKAGCEWIAPVPDEKGKKCYRRLINYLILREMIKFVDQSKVPLSGVIANTGKITLYQGQGKGDLNKSGLILRLYNTLLAGDCTYQYWPVSLINDIDKIENLIVPHHGGGIDVNDVTELNKRTKYKRGRAVICVGENEYGHPLQKHITKLAETFKIVEKTSSWNSGIFKDTMLIV